MIIAIKVILILVTIVIIWATSQHFNRKIWIGIDYAKPRSECTVFVISDEDRQSWVWKRFHIHRSY